MNSILLIVLVLIFVDLYYRFRQQKKLNGLFFYSSVMSDYYEQILLSKEILSKSEVRYMKEQIEKDLKEFKFSQKDIASLKCRIAGFNPAYNDAIGSIMYNFEDKEKLNNEIQILGELLYSKDYKGFGKEMDSLKASGKIDNIE